MQSKINSYNDIVFEWIPYNQFDNIKEIGEGGFAKVYSAIWVDGPLLYSSDTQEYTRNQDKNVVLKCLYNSQNITSEFLNEAKLYSIENHENYYGNKILKIYGISQNPDTKEYIIVLDYAIGGNFNYWMNKNYKNFGWPKKTNILFNISNGLKEIHQKNMVHRDFHTGNNRFKYYIVLYIFQIWDYVEMLVCDVNQYKYNTVQYPLNLDGGLNTLKCNFNLINSLSTYITL
ncbi:unnamed protein product [Rhizophagus irregularis]|nr:unnamed protein product [Rhizophagus irregularis]